jgi:hypothetical protein
VVSQCELDSHGAVQGSEPGSCEHGNERPFSITGWPFTDQMSDCYLFMKESVQWSYLVAIIFIVCSLDEITENVFAIKRNKAVLCARYQLDYVCSSFIALY